MMGKQKSNRYRKFLAIQVIFLGCIWFSLHACSRPEEKPNSEISVITDAKPHQITIENKKISAVEGGVFFIDLESTSKLSEATADVRGKIVRFYEVSHEGELFHYQALAGLEFGTAFGNLEVPVRGCFVDPPLVDPSTEKDRNCDTVIVSVDVKTGEYPSEKLTVPPRSVEPSKKDLVRIRKEQKILNAMYAASPNVRLWEGPIQLPLNTEITSVYGSNRKYNGHVAGVHYGTDFRAPVGTPISSALKGKVVLAQSLFFTGNTVILDHGYGFFTLYCHMSKIQVHKGAVIGRGQKLGLSGATGRVSGPHLHWGVKLNGSKVDPMSVVKLLETTTGK